MRRRLAAVVFLAMATAHLGLSAAPQVRVPAASSRPDPNFKPFQTPGFSLNVPKKNWEPILIGIGSAFLVLPEKSREASVAIEVLKVLPLGENEIVEQTATLEVDEWKLRRPLATNFTHRIEPGAGGKVIVIDFTQPGAKGPERVRLYALPRGSQWYRVICTATEATFGKFEGTFRTMAMSLTPAAPQ